MKTLILYASHYGATHEIARRIQSHMDDSALHDLKQGGAPSIAEYDCVIIGSPLYAGLIQKEVKAFVIKNAEGLRGKSIGLLLSGFEAENEQEYFEKNFPKDILDSAKAKCFTGGIYDPAKAGLLHKLMLKAAGKQMPYTDTIDNEKIKQFAEVMRG